MASRRDQQQSDASASVANTVAASVSRPSSAGNTNSATGGPSDRDGSSSAESEATEPPSLKATPLPLPLPIRPPRPHPLRPRPLLPPPYQHHHHHHHLPRLSHTSSSGGLSSRSVGSNQSFRTSIISSSNSSRSSSGGRRGFGNPHRALRRSFAQDSDPCLLASSFENWSDDDEVEETKQEHDNFRMRPAVQRSQTEKAGSVMSQLTTHAEHDSGGSSDSGDSDDDDTDTKGSTPVVAPLFIRIRKFASTSTLELRPGASGVYPPPLSPLGPAAAQQPSFSTYSFSSAPLGTHRGSLASAASVAMLEHAQSTMEEGFELEDGTTQQPLELSQEQQQQQQKPLVVLPISSLTSHHHRRSWCDCWSWWSSDPRFRRWYGRILNSYFAFWVAICSLVVALLDVLLLLLVLTVLRRTPTAAAPAHDECHVLTDGGRLGAIHYIGAVASVLLALPVLLPVEMLELYKKRADRRMIRRPFLHVCELLVMAEVAFLLYFAVAEFYRLPFTVECHRASLLSELVFLYATLLLYGVLWWQLVVFCRFLVHLKLQADAANDATHTSALSDYYGYGLLGFLVSTTTTRRVRKAPQEEPPGAPYETQPRAPQETQPQREAPLGDVKTFKKLLFRAAARGDADEVDRLLADPSKYGLRCNSTSTSGADGLTYENQSVCALYATPPTLWLYACAASVKNPLHIAAQRGHVAIVRRLLRAGFNANTLDKVARVNFNLGLLFKIATRWLVKTQDGFRSPLRGVLCSVLLPPLHGAVAAGHVDVVRLLLEQGHADPNVLPRASFYYPSAVIPAIFLADDPEIIKLLVAKGANFLHVATTTLSGGLAARTYATPLQRSALTQRSATTEYLLSCGGDVALTPLHEAAATDNVRTIKRLLRQRRRQQGDETHGHSVDTLGERVEGVQRRTPLHWAAIVGKEHAAQALLERGADPNARDRYGRTPLHWASRNNHAAVVLLLLAHGADATAEDASGTPVLSFAAEAEGVDTRVVTALVSHGASLKHELSVSRDTPLHIALARENRATATALIRCGADLMATNSAGTRAVDVTTSTKLQFALKKEAGMRDVMISYPHSHFAFAQRVRETLETQGKLTCWMDTMDPSGIGGGAVWREEIARGIHNCSVVVSVVCGGYTKSEWCLKELAFAKMIRKPVVALMLTAPIESFDEKEEMEMEEEAHASPLDGLVPLSQRIAFHDFILRDKAPPRGTNSHDFEVDEMKLEAAWQTLLPQLMDVMRKDAGGASGGRGTPTPARIISSSSSSAGSTSRSGRAYSQCESEPEEEEEKDDDKRTAMSVAVYATATQSALRDRLVRDLCARGVDGRALVSSDGLELPSWRCRVLVVVLESLGAEATREQRHAACEQLTALLHRAARLRVRVVPIVARDEFLSFSNLYTLARSQLLYFVGGVCETQSMATLMQQLQQSANESERRRV